VGESSVARIRSGWKKVQRAVAAVAAAHSRVFSLHMMGRVFEAYVRSVVLYGSETWAVKEEDLTRLEKNDMRMVRWMCGVTLKGRKSSEEFRDRLGLVMSKGWRMLTGLRSLGRLRWLVGLAEVGHGRLGMRSCVCVVTL